MEVPRGDVFARAGFRFAAPSDLHEPFHEEHLRFLAEDERKNAAYHQPKRLGDLCPTGSTKRRAIVPRVTFPLAELASQVATRAEVWARLALVWRTKPISQNYRKPMVSSEFESAAWLALISVWSTGEADLETVRIGDGRVVNKIYHLRDRDELAALLDEFVALLVEDRDPDAAFVARWPELE